LLADGMCAAIEKRDFGASQPAARKQSYISSYDESMSDDRGNDRGLLAEADYGLVDFK
jgi:hypothetical protein